MNGLIANAINVTLNSFKGLQVVPFKLSYLSGFIAELKQILLTNSSVALESFLIDNNSTISEIFHLSQSLFLGKKSSKSPGYETQIAGHKSNSNQCYSLNEKSHGLNNISIPFIDKCYHISIIDSAAQNKYINFNRNNFSINNISTEIITSILSSLGVVKVANCLNMSSSNIILTNLNRTCLAITGFNNFNHENYLLHLSNMTQFNVILHSFSEIRKTLSLRCTDTAMEIHNLLQNCLSYNESKSCYFSCPITCNLEQTNNVWQIKPFNYLSQSSICQSAYHSNTLTVNTGKNVLNGFLLWNINKPTKHENISILNNGIISNLWPSNKGISQTHQNVFSFKGSPLLETHSKLSSDEAFVLVKALFKSNELKMIDVHIYYSSEFNNFNFNLRKLLHNSEGPEIEYSITASSINSATLTWITLYPPDINSFYDLKINFKESIKFPVNVYNDEEILVTASKNVYRYQIDEPFEIKITGDFSDLKRISCKWYYMNYKSKMKCVDNFNLLSQKGINDPQNQIIIIHPQVYMNKLRQFSRVHLLSNSEKSQEKCFNKGIFDGHRCFCFPGYGGVTCDQTCNENSFGRNCEFECPGNNCQGYLLCSVDPIGCSCLPGFFGYDCNKKCLPNHWGPNCQNNCLEICKEECNAYNGQCSFASPSMNSTTKKIITDIDKIQCQSSFAKKCHNGNKNFHFFVKGYKIYTSEIEIICFTSLKNYTICQTNETLSKEFTCVDIEVVKMTADLCEGLKVILNFMDNSVDFILQDPAVTNQMEINLSIDQTRISDSPKIHQIEFYLVNSNKSFTTDQIFQSNFIGSQVYTKGSHAKILITSGYIYKPLTSYKLFGVFEFLVRNKTVKIIRVIKDVRTACSLSTWGTSCQNICEYCLNDTCYLSDGKCFESKCSFDFLKPPYCKECKMYGVNKTCIELNKVVKSQTFIVFDNEVSTRISIMWFATLFVIVGTFLFLRGVRSFKEKKKLRVSHYYESMEPQQVPKESFD